LRAPALLEDSGSSSIYLSIGFSVIIIYIMFAKLKLFLKLILIFGVSFIYFLVGMALGRVFYLGTFSAIIIALIFLFKPKNAFLTLGGIGLLLAFYYFKISFFERLCQYSASCMKISNQFLDFQNSYLSHPEQSFLERLAYIDPVRSLHYEVMLKALSNNIWGGTGLGSFGAHYSEYAKHHFAYQYFFDNPSSLYLMLASELGIVGIILCVVFVSLFLLSVFKFLFVKQKERKNFSSHTLVFTVIPIGIALSLSASFFIGIHIVFPVISSLACYSLIGILFFFKKQDYWLNKALPLLFFTCAVYLIGVVVLMLPNIPRVPEFRWRASGVSQAPYPLVVPTQFAQQAYAHSSAPNLLNAGQWMSAKTEILLFHKTIPIYIFNNIDKFPVTLKLRFFDQKNKIFEEQNIEVNHPTWLSLASQNAEKLKCFENISYENYCSLKLSVSPFWHWSGQKVGFFMEDKFLFYRSL
ncbi:MAG: O-antigen ligase family protein, partial [Silvanigrellaceae bacterium]|nr:O-antigen ligase family protein [Silvanigrellaceae bacterium]